MTDKLQSKLNGCKSSKEKKASLCTLKIAYKNIEMIRFFKYLNQDIRGNCYKQSNNYCLKKTDVNKIDLKPTPITLYRCSFSSIPVDENKLVMLERAYGGCLGTKSR